MATAGSLPAARREGGEIVAAFRAARARLGLIALLLALAAIAWVSTTDRMRGMDDGPGSDLGALGWFVGVWVVMMAAMMLPSVAPTVALHARMTRRKSPLAPLAFCAGYLVTWAAAGVAAYGLFALGRAALGDQLTWSGAGRWVAGGTLAVAAAYELTPYKDACLTRCRSPLAFLLGAWRDGARGALRMGAKHGAWCVGCCWGLMAALFALGIMSLVWMAVVAALIGLEKTLPWRRAVTYVTAALLLAGAVALVAAPEVIPGLTLPGNGGMDAMQAMPVAPAP